MNLRDTRVQKVGDVYVLQSGDGFEARTIAVFLTTADAREFRAAVARLAGDVTSAD